MLNVLFLRTGTAHGWHDFPRWRHGQAVGGDDTPVIVEMKFLNAMLRSELWYGLHVCRAYLFELESSALFIFDSFAQCLFNERIICASTRIARIEVFRMI